MKQELIDLTKNQIEFKESGEIIGLFILDGKEEIKSKIDFTHKLPDLNTRVNLRFILLDEANLDLEATMQIERGAERTDTYLKIDVLLLSEKANAHVVPSMEIKEDEVKGGHGATIGMLDEKQIWYLMSRGIDRLQAEKIMVEAFTKAIIEKVENQEIKENMTKSLGQLR